MTYRILDYCFSLDVQGDLPVDGLLSHLLHGFITPDEAPTDGYTIRKRGGSYAVTKNGRAITEYENDEQLASGLEWSLIEQATRGSSAVCVHAAALVRREQGVLLVGPSGSGKSTLSAALMLSGWLLLSDELAPFNAGSRCAIPFPRVMCLKGAAPELLSRLEDTVGLLAAPDAFRRVGSAHCFLRADFRPDRLDAPVRHILFVTYRPGVESGLLPIPAPRALSMLISSTPNFKEAGPVALDVLGDLVDNARAQVFEFDDLQPAVVALEKLIDPCLA